MPQEQPSSPKIELIMRMFMSVLDEGSGILKLYFTLSTGPVVLFVNVLVISRAPRLVLILWRQQSACLVLRQSCVFVCF